MVNSNPSPQGIGKNAVRTELELAGFSVSFINGFSIIVANRQDIGRLGVRICSRMRQRGDNEERINVANNDLIVTKFENWCHREKVVPWLALYVHPSGDIYMTSLDNYRAKYRGHGKTPVWKMEKVDKENYGRDTLVMHINVNDRIDLPKNWFGFH